MPLNRLSDFYVDRRRLNVNMPQYLLDTSNVTAGLKRMCGKRMTQRMRLSIEAMLIARAITREIVRGERWLCD